MEVILANSQSLLDESLKVRATVFVIEKGVPEHIQFDEEDLLNKNCDHFLVKDNNTLIGAFRCYHIDDNTIQVQRFCIIKEFRNKGLGKDTLNYIESYYSKNNIKNIVLDAKFHVYKFYEKCGYTKISDIFEEAGIPHVKMSKNL